MRVRENKKSRQRHARCLDFFAVKVRNIIIKLNEPLGFNPLSFGLNPSRNLNCSHCGNLWVSVPFRF